MDAADVHDADQTQGRLRDYARSLARDVAAYRKELLGAGMSDETAATLTERFNDAWLAAHVEAQAGVGVDVSLVWGDDE